MVPIYLKLTNFLSHVSSEINFSELDFVTLIIGVNRGDPNKANGTGKSSLFDAITWALFEKSRVDGSASTSMDNIVRQGTDKAEVEFHFKLGDDLYRVVRSRDKKKRKSDVVFQVMGDKRWQAVGGDSKKETTSKIISTIGIDYDVFVNSVLLRQHETSAFATMTSGERKDVVSRILQLTHYDEYSIKAKNRADEIGSKLIESDSFLVSNSSVAQQKSEAEQELSTILQQVEVHQKRLSSLQKVVEQIREQQAEEGKKLAVKKELLNSQNRLKERITGIIKSIQDSTKQVIRYEKEITTLKESLNKKHEQMMQIKESRGDPNLIKKQLTDSQEKVQVLTEEHTNLLVKVQTLIVQVEKDQAEHKRVGCLHEGQCPTCYSSVTQEGKHSVLKELSGRTEAYKKELMKYKEKLSAVKEAKVAFEKILIEVQAKRDEYNRKQEEGRILLSEVHNGKERLTGFEESLRDAQNAKQQSNQDLIVVQNEITESLDKIEQMGSIDISKFEQLGREVIEKNNEAMALTSTINQVQVKKGVLQERIESKNKILQQIEEVQKNRASLVQQQRLYKELAQAFSKTGIQALILENSAIEIEKIANELLGKITDGRVSIKIQTQKPNQDGTFKEVFDVIITDEFHSSPFNLYSGGEQARIALAIRLALSTLLARRSGVKISAIFYDEAFTDLDRDGTDKLMDVFRALSSNFRYQLVITHQSELKNQFDDVLVINKTSEGSFIGTDKEKV